MKIFSIKSTGFFKRIGCISFVLLILLCVNACSKKKNNLSQEGESELTGAKNIQAYAGKYRIKLTWEVREKNIDKVVVGWNNSHSKEVDYSGVDSMGTIINNLKEGKQTFTLTLFDDKGNASKIQKITKRVYGDEYIKGIEGREIKNILWRKGKVEINWEDASQKNFGSVLTYEQKDGKQGKVTIAKGKRRTLLSDFKLGSSIKYKTSYLPEKEALDTLMTRVNKVGPLSLSNMTVKWDKSTRTTIASPGGYCRAIQLDDGDLLAVHEVAGEIATARSIDSGKTWNSSGIIVNKEEGYNMTTPSLIQLKNGTILAAYNPRPVKGDGAHPDPAKHYAIRIIKSNDGGRSWGNDQLLFQAGYRNTVGCWEPAMVQLPDGEIQLFFSNEKPYVNSNEQNISLLRSDDNGEHWTSIPKTASFRPGHRDGMPVPIVIPEQKQVLFSIEDNGGTDFKPYIIRNSFQEDWQTAVGANDVDRDYALTKHFTGEVYAGAPFLARLKNGLTILSFQSTENRRKQWNLSCMNVAIGDSTGKNFHNISKPFNIPLEKHGMWNSLCVLDDGTILAITATNAFSPSNGQQVEAIKGALEFLYRKK